MTVAIVSAPPKGEIIYARIGLVLEGKRYLHVRRRHEDGNEYDELSLLAWSPNKKMTVVPNIGGDLDDAYLKGIVESVEGRKDGVWHYKCDITQLYHDFNAQRAAEFVGQKQFAMNTKKET